MEAKVDIRKLQVLSDRINQATEALNQVRTSVHGLSHTTAGVPFGYGIGTQSQMGPVGYNPMTQPYGQGQMSPWTTGFVPGLQHSTGLGQSQYGVPQFSGIPYGIGLGMQGQVNPWQSQYSTQFAPQFNPMLGQMGQVGQMGLQHSMGGQLPFGGQQPMTQSFGQQPFYGYSPVQSNVGQPFGIGLQHSTATQPLPTWGNMPQMSNVQGPMGITPEIMEQRVLEARASDPLRLAQTFLYAFSYQAPFGTW